MPTLRSHTHLQATQANTQTKACKRVCLPNRTTDRQADDRKEQRRHNSTYKKLAVQCSADSFVVNQTLVLRINICGKNRQLLVAAKR
jgi:predicted glycosyltransferase